ncbi:hypothetical protein M0812_01523 [Anaeramoeba flamelloides]|uniref:RRM domain-containing protein n=1 Tax=Anaeramoeba flamelloides TaxID=1746091 RepID=A0AAV8AA02_9EUKA|nr:hypothetical protein M0812_01523 [Anaeramoeba flamelloides]
MQKTYQNHKKKSRYNMEIDPPKFQNLNCQNNTKNEKKDHKRSKISTHSGSSINYEFLPNTIFMHNIPYHANYYDIESLMKPYIEIKELILFLDMFNRFKGSAKIILRKEEEYEKILNYSGKLSIFNRLIFLNKFRIKKNNTSQKKINNNENFKRNQFESSNQHEEKNIKDIKNKEWFEKNFLNKNNDKNNDNKNNKKKGDPLSPLLFGFITHFLLEKIKSLAIHVQIQLLYGLEIFDLTKTDFKDIDTWINKKITKFLLINPHSPRLIYKTEAKIDPVRITIYKRRFKLIQKLKILHYDELINYLPFRKKESENINWYSKNLKQLENELENFRIKNLENSPSWKVQEYLKIVQINNTINKQQRYLKWKGSTSILKLRNFTNYLNRYSYVMNKNKSKLCELCKKNKQFRYY